MNVTTCTSVLPILAALGLSLAADTAALAEGKPSWTTRCRREIGKNNDAETATYYFQTPGMVEGAQGRASIEYKTSGKAWQTVYPTAEKDFMSQFSGASISIDQDAKFATNAGAKPTLKVGQISVIASARDGKRIAGDVKIRLMIDGKSFGPYAPKESSLGSGLYSLWFDTAETDGDSKPPVLKPAQFNALAKALEPMKAGEMLLEREGTVIARLPVAVTKAAGWRTEFLDWAAKARSGVTAYRGGCPNWDDIAN